MNKKIFIIIMALMLALVTYIFFCLGESSAAPTQSYMRSIVPETNSTYDLGTSTNRWKGIYGDLIDATSLVIGSVTSGCMTVSGVSTSTICGDGSLSYIGKNLSVGTTTPNGTLNIASGTSQFFNITSAGKVGIGTTTPVELLHVYKSSALTALLETPSNANPALKLKSGANIWAISHQDTFNGGNLLFNFGGTSYTTNALEITTAGKIGIGTSTPNGLLTIASSTTTDVTDLLINPAVKASGNLIDAQVNGTTKFSVSSVGTAYAIGMSSYSFSDPDNKFSLINNYNSLFLGSGFNIAWRSLSTWGTANDISISRYGAGVLGVGNGTAGDITGTLLAGKVAIGTSTISGILNVASSTSQFFNIDSSGKIGIATTSQQYHFTIASTTGSLSVGMTNDSSVIGDKFKITSEGGYAIKLKNGSGATSVRGYLVSASSTAGYYFPTPIGDPDTIGLVYDAVSDGADGWVVVSGIGEAYFATSTTAGYFARMSTSTDTGAAAGTAISESNPTPPFATDKHFLEIGHLLEGRIGAGLAKIVIHFN